MSLLGRNSLRATMAAVALLLTVPFAEAQTKVKTGYNMFSPEQDVEIGRQSAAQAEQQLPMLRDSRIDDYVDSLGERLAAAAPGPKFDYHFAVVNASDLNAFALPGGYIYLNRGILESAKNEGEIAGVLAHEIAHVALRHGTHNASKAQMTQAGLGILGGLLGGKVGPNAAQAINVLGGVGLNALFLKYSRDAETDADIIGAQVLARSGYNPQDQVTFFQTLAKTEKKRTANWMSSHPAPDRRIERIQKEARLLGLEPKSTTSTGRLNEVQSSLARMGQAPTMEQIAQGARPSTNDRSNDRSRGARDRPATRSSVEPPSSQTKTYTSRAGIYQVQAPANWQIHEQSNSGVTIAPPGGLVDLGNATEIVVGAVINHYEPFGNTRSNFNSETTSIEDATEDLIIQIRQTSPHLNTVRGSGRQFRLAGGKGLGATLVGTSRNSGVKERVTVVTRQLEDGHLIYLLFISPDRDAATYSPVFNTMLQSMQVDEHRRH